MTCPDPADLDACLDQTPCPHCPSRRVTVDGVVWEYDRAQGWHDPEETPDDT